MSNCRGKQDKAVGFQSRVYICQIFANRLTNHLHFARSFRRLSLTPAENGFSLSMRELFRCVSCWVMPGNYASDRSRRMSFGRRQSTTISVSTSAPSFLRSFLDARIYRGNRFRAMTPFQKIAANNAIATGPKRMRHREPRVNQNGIFMERIFKTPREACAIS